MNLSRRTLVASMTAAAGSHLLLRHPTLAQGTPEASPVAVETGESGMAAPGFALARVRTLTDSSQSQHAVFPHVMADFLPPTREVEGYGGYVIAIDEMNPAVAITLTLLAGESGAEQAG